TETFAYAEGFDEGRKRYKGLRAGEAVRVLLDGQSVLVKPEAATAQKQADAKTTVEATNPSGEATGKGGAVVTPPLPGGTGEKSVEPPIPQLRRFHASVRLDPLRLGRDASQIAEEVVQHLTRIVGSEVEITLEIRAELPEQASEKLVRDVTENC